MNINMLQDSDDNAGFYAAACASGSGSWKGATLFRSSDLGATYQSIASFIKSATIGTVLNTLGDFRSGNIPDELNYIVVQLNQGTLASTTYAGFLENSQMIVVGDEIISYRTATMDSTNSNIFTLTGLLRGLRGSDYAIGTHGPSERLVLVDSSALITVPDSSASFGIQRQYKAVTSGASLTGSTAESFTNVGARLKPYAPVNIGAGRLADGSVVINWVRRNRTNGEWRNLVDVPMSEAAESYQIDIYDDYRYSNVLRTLSSSSTSVTYAAADQTTDFGSTQAQLYVIVYQMSAIVGRGYAAKGIV